jgi:hypothetical protein
MAYSAQAIRTYRLYLLDNRDHIVTAHEIEAGSDEEACARAAALLKEHAVHPAIEVWDRTRKVCHHRNSADEGTSAAPLKA